MIHISSLPEPLPAGRSGAQLPCWENPQNLAKVPKLWLKLCPDSAVSCRPQFSSQPQVDSRGRQRYSPFSGLPLWSPRPDAWGFVMCVGVPFPRPQSSFPWLYKRELGACPPWIGPLPDYHVGRGQPNRAEGCASLTGWGLRSPWPGRGRSFLSK